MVKFNDSLRDGVFLSGYDMAKGAFSKKQLYIPKAKDLGSNFIAGAGYNYLLKPITEMGVKKLIPDMPKEGEFLGKTLGFMLGLGMTDKLLMGRQMPGLGQLLMKSLIVTGAESML